MATFSELTGELLHAEIASDDTSILFTSTRRNMAVNEGMLEFAELTECFVRQSTVVCSCNTAEYNLNSSAVLSTDFVRFADQGAEYHHLSSGSSAVLRVVSGDDFLRRDVFWRNRYEPGWRPSTGVVDLPTGYYLRTDGGQYLLGLNERPDIGSSEVGKVLLPYIARPPLMTSSTDVPFTVASQTRTDLMPFHRAIVHWAAAQLEKLRGDWDAHQRQLTLFMSYVERFKEKARPKGGGFVTFGTSYLRIGPRATVSQRGLDPYKDFI